MAICPIMSYAANQVKCERENCQLWDSREETCSIAASSVRISDTIERLVSTLNEIKVKF